ncbi:MAG TPA: hypothetical protein VFP68_20210 [Burkholderiaceae bacterium]|nr:hypothetical protein [Burkholderiaceae bacterium]
MWLAGNRRSRGDLDLYIGTRAFAFAGKGRRHTEAALDGIDAVFLTMEAHLDNGAEGSSRVRVWLSGALCRPFVVPVLPGVRTQDELHRAAMAMAAARTGLPGPCEVWLDAGPLDRSRVAVAMHREVLDRLLQVLRARRDRIVSIRPWWSGVLDEASRRDANAPAIAAVDDESLTVLLGHGDAIESVNCISPIIDADAATAALARALISSDVESGRELVGRLRLDADQSAKGIPWLEWLR